MSKEYIVIDRSTSTSWEGFEIYWGKVKEYLSAVKDQNVSCILWGSGEPEDIKIAEFLKYFTSKGLPKEKIQGATDPSTFVKKLVHDPKGIVLTLFTDGDINISEVNKCAEELEKNDIRIKRLNTFLISNSEINLSVVAPFLRTHFVSVYCKPC